MPMAKTDLRASIDIGAVVYAETKETFSTGQFTEFLRMGGVTVEEEEAGEILLELATGRNAPLCEIRPGVYAKAVSA